ncbi:beta/alpha barrel domain-containing protein [Azohydromonas lata]|uniref:Hydroxymethylglutaryl-CoA lyase n=1 Tax=Azohydromonas lata TaxID=45677 RepID=A0ABU5INT1_9BURK|nr:hydroxymethylglutaryl-CoA lyase [Azohydromonas lata]MDZ5460532.1 hydroxymethylglutaryl-CoA lyase [Azohydromonas lata]
MESSDGASRLPHSIDSQNHSETTVEQGAIVKHARADATPRLLPEKIEIREVGLRDALQSLRQALPTGLKCDWILLAHAAGLREIEVGAFVSPTEFPQMADTAEVVAFAKTIAGLKVSVVVHDMDGARSAIAAGADVLTLPISASEMHSRANVGRTSAELVEQLRLVRAECEAVRSSCCIEAVISTAFGCALQGDVDPAAVLQIVESVVDAGTDGISLGDSFGVATPNAVYDLFQRTRALLPQHVMLGAHLHRAPDNRLGNVMAAVEAGVTRFDASLGGIGGSAVSAGVVGNVPLEDVATLFNMIGVETGVDVNALLDLRKFIGEQSDAQALFQAVARAATRRRGGLF